MLNIDFGVKGNKKSLNCMDILNFKTKPESLTEILDFINTLSLGFNENNFFTIEDLVKYISINKISYNDDLNRVRVLELIVNISNDPDLSTNYSYLVEMLKIESNEWGNINGPDGREGTITTLKFPDIKNKDEKILNTFIKLFNVLGYEQFIVIINFIIRYDIDLSYSVEME